MSKPRLLLVFWLGLSVCAGVFLWQGHPEGLLRWLLLAMFAPPAYLLLSAAGDLLGFVYSRLPGLRHANEFVEQKTKQRSISGLRVLWYLISTLVAVAFVAAVACVVRAHS
jgi:hypothetical protein